MIYVNEPYNANFKHEYFFSWMKKSTAEELLMIYPQTSNISHSLVGNKIVDHSDVVGASPVGAAPTTSSFSS